MQRIGVVAYRVRLPKEISDIYNVFHISQLKKYLRVPKEQISPDIVDLQDDLRYQEVPIKILEVVTKQTRTTTFQIYHVQWSKHTEAEAIWEREDALRKEFPHLFRTQPNLEDEIPFKWDWFITSLKIHIKKSLTLKSIFKIYFKNYKSFELYIISFRFFFIHPSYPSSNIYCTTWHQYHLSVPYLSLAHLFSLIPGNDACADPTAAAAHSRPEPLPSALARTRTVTCRPHLPPFSRSSFVVQKDSKSQRTAGHHSHFSHTNDSKYQQHIHSSAAS